MGFIIDSALGHNIIIEPFEKSTVLKAEETATVFKILSLGIEVDRINCGNSWYQRYEFKVGDLIIVEPNSVQKAVMGDKDVYYIKDSDVLAKVKVG